MTHVITEASRDCKLEKFATFFRIHVPTLAVENLGAGFHNFCHALSSPTFMFFVYARHLTILAPQSTTPQFHTFEPRVPLTEKLSARKFKTRISLNTPTRPEPFGR